MSFGYAQKGRPKIAVVPTAFGFGPASKAHSIGEEVASGYDAEVVYYGEASAFEYFSRQSDVEVRALSPDPDQNVAALAKFDAIINVLEPRFVVPQLVRKTHYVDSLGFMWGSVDLPPESHLRQVRAYYCQDIFGSADNLTGLGLANVVAVSGIVAESSRFPTSHSGPHADRLVNLGGLSNPAGNLSADAYLPLIDRLLPIFNEDGVESIVVGNDSTALGLPSKSVRLTQLSRAMFDSTMRSCDVVISSPGMTTLIESSKERRAYVPLPPQNWSQVLICRGMIAGSDLSLWEFLAEQYHGIDDRLPELAKANAVRDVNRLLSSSDGFLREYTALARTALELAEVPQVGAPYTGAKAIANCVAESVI